MNCLELTVFSGHRHEGTNINKAHYNITNGPIFVGKVAVKSCTLYNTIPNISNERAHMSFVQDNFDGSDDAQGLIDITITTGTYTGDELATAIQEKMLTALTPTVGASVAVIYNSTSHRLEFTWDLQYSYYYEPSYKQYYITSPGFFLPYKYWDTSPDVHIIGSTFVAGTYRLDEWLEYCASVITADIQVHEPTAVFTMKAEYYVSGNFKVKYNTTVGTFMIPGSESTNSQYIGMDAVGMDGNGIDVFDDNYTSTIDFPYTATSTIMNPIEPVLNFLVDDGSIVNPNYWQTGSINLSGDLYLNFRSRVLANKNHRTIDNARDTTFFSMPITTSYRQLQYYEPQERVWIDFHGGVELTDFEIDLYNEYDEPVKITQNYVLELLIQQTNVF